ncbi:MAG: prepilin-type N-terminal cleavage/methylation domain-containing protein, partial [Bdellovibrionota bacterium]
MATHSRNASRYNSSLFQELLFKNQPGFGLIEVMVAAGLLGVMALGAATMFKQQNDQILALRIVSTRDNLRNLSDKYVADSGAIAVSTDNTLPLKFPGAT